MFIVYDTARDNLPIGVFEDEKDPLIISQVSGYQYQYRELPLNTQWRTVKVFTGIGFIENDEVKFKDSYSINNSIEFSIAPLPQTLNCIGDETEVYACLKEPVETFTNHPDIVKFFEVRANWIWRGMNK